MRDGKAPTQTLIVFYIAKLAVEKSDSPPPPLLVSLHLECVCVVFHAFYQSQVFGLTFRSNHLLSYVHWPRVKEGSLCSFCFWGQDRQFLGIIQKLRLWWWLFLTLKKKK